MTTKTAVFETQHEDMIHDAQMDYYGKRLATASSDRTVKIFQVADEQQTLIAHLKGHDGPVWQVAWAHPKFGSVLASCSYDGRLVVWKETQTPQGASSWMKCFEDVNNARTSVNSISFAPESYGLVVAAASSDGSVCVYSHREDQNWDKNRIDVAHVGGVNAVSWGPAVLPGAMIRGPQGQQIQPTQRFVTGGCDNRIKIWGIQKDGQWVEQDCFQNRDNAHHDWVRDVAWAPGLGLQSSTIASCSEDKTAVVWVEEDGVWRKAAKPIVFGHKVWRVSWSPMGNILAISQGDNKVSLWKEALDGEWKSLSSVEEDRTQPQ